MPRRRLIGAVGAATPTDGRTVAQLVLVWLASVVVTSCASGGASPTAVASSASPAAAASSTTSPAPFPSLAVAAGWATTGPMADGRVFFTATRLADGKVLVAGGFANGDGSGALASAELYDPRAGTWQATGAMHEARAGHTATLLADGTVLIAGGGSSPADTSGTAEVFEPGSGSWTATGRMDAARGSHTATRLADGKVLVAGGGAGTRSSGIEASAELYDPKTRSWTPTGTLHGARTLHTATSLADGSVLVVGGQSRADTALASAERYDPATGSWAAASRMATGRAGHIALLLDDGRVLVAGGVDGGFTGDLTPDEILASAELFDPVGMDWLPTGSLSTARFGFVAVRLADHRVLVAAGDTLGTGPLASSELYDSSAGSWSVTRSMIEGRAGHAIVLLETGLPMVVGGEGPGGVGLSSAELFDPGARP